MTIDQIKTALDAFVASGGNVDNLNNNDKLYRQIKDADIYDGDRRLSTDEKFRLAGHPRTKKPNALERVKAVIDEFIANGGTLEQIKKGTPEYTEIKNTTVYLPNKRRATMEEKFTLAGYERRPRRAVSFEEIKQLLDDYVEQGGNIDDLGVDDPLYQLVKNYTNRKNLYEKFAMFGYTRSRKKSESAWDDLHRLAHQYVAEGKSLHIERKKLPFYESMHTAKRSYFRKYGRRITSREALERVGIKGYSDIYYDFLPLFDLEKYQDSYGYVDSYRKDTNLNACIDRYAEYLGMPVSLVVSLVADQRLEKSYLQTDTLAFISQQLKEYKETYDSFDNISRTDPQLYNRLCRLKRVVKTESGKPISTRELVELLGHDDNHETFRDTTEIQEIDFEQDIAPLVDFAHANGNKISARHISPSIYRRLLDYTARNSTNISSFFETFGVEYEDSRKNQLYTKLCIDKFPYLHEMKQMRNELVKALEFEHPEFTKEERFEHYLEICKHVYQTYKPLIEVYGLNEDFDSSKLKDSAPSSMGE